VVWTPDESKSLYLKAREWWDNDKEIFKIEFPDGPFGPQGKTPVMNTLGEMGEFLARVILPTMETANDDHRQQLNDWLREMRDVGAFPTIALPYVLVQCPSDAAAMGETILADLNSDDQGAVSAAARATRHWVHLAAIGRVPSPPARLVPTLIERVVFRRKTGIVSCLQQLSFLLVEKPEQINAQQAALISGSLVPWNNAIILPAEDEHGGDYPESKRPDLRVLVGRLAGSLALWYAKSIPGEPEPSPITLWRNLCGSDPLPEVRRAFDSLKFLEH
jgi:hypothetical protein